MENLFSDIFKADAQKHGASYAMFQALKRAKKQATGKGFPAQQLSAAERYIRKAFKALDSKTVSTDQIKDVAHKLAEKYSCFEYALESGNEHYPAEKDPLGWVKHPTLEDKQAAAQPKAKPSGSIFSSFQYF